MPQLSESDFPSTSHICLIEQALNTLKHTVSAHLECETRLEQLYLGWQQSWLSQFSQLHVQIEALEARISPWINETGHSPRLAVVSHHDDVG